MQQELSKAKNNYPDSALYSAIANGGEIQSIIPASAMALPEKPFKPVRCGLQISPCATEPDILSLVAQIRAITQQLAWVHVDVADFVLEHHFGRAAESLARALGLKKSLHRLQDLARVARLFPHEMREPKLSVSHHEVIARYAPSAKYGSNEAWRTEATQWQKHAIEQRPQPWSVEQLTNAMGGSRKRDKLIRDLGIAAQTQECAQLLNKLPTPTTKLSAEGLQHCRLVIDDLTKLKTYLEELIAGKADTSATKQALSAALDDYLRQEKKDFTRAAVEHNLSVSQLSQYRLQKAAELRAQKLPYAEIKRQLGVKPEDLKQFLKSRAQECPAQNATQDAPTPPTSATTDSQTPAPPEKEAATSASVAYGNGATQPVDVNGLASSALGDQHGNASAADHAKKSRAASDAKALEAALQLIEHGRNLFDAAREYRVEIPDLIEHRHAACERLFKTTKSVPVVSKKYRIQSRDRRSYLEKRGLLAPTAHTPGKEAGDGQ